jgi:hypothetical protein
MILPSRQLNSFSMILIGDLSTTTGSTIFIRELQSVSKARFSKQAMVSHISEDMQQGYITPQTENKTEVSWFLSSLSLSSSIITQSDPIKAKPF